MISWNHLFHKDRNGLFLICVCTYSTWQPNADQAHPVLLMLLINEWINNLNVACPWSAGGFNEIMYVQWLVQCWAWEFYPINMRSLPFATRTHYLRHLLWTHMVQRVTNRMPGLLWGTPCTPRPGHQSWCGLSAGTPRWAAPPCIVENHAVGTFGNLESRKRKALDVLMD